MPDWEEIEAPDALDAWDALAANAVQPNPFLERFALAPFASQGSGPLRLLGVREGSTLIGLAALTDARGYARLPIRHAASWRHPHLFDATPLVMPGAEHAFARGLFAWLDEAAGSARFLHLTHLRAGPVADALMAVAGEEGRRCEVVASEDRPFLPWDRWRDFDAYLQDAVGSGTRKSVRRRRRQLEARGTVTLAVLGPGEDARLWIDAFARAEHAGWKGAAGTSLASRPDERAAFAAMATAAHERGRLVAAQLRVDGEAVAHTLDLRAQDGAFCLKIASEPQWDDHAPGVLMEAALIERGMGLAGAGGPRWADSCAAAGHDVLSRLWPETRPLLQLAIERRGHANRVVYRAARGLERLSGMRRRR